MPFPRVFHLSLHQTLGFRFQLTSSSQRIEPFSCRRCFVRGATSASFLLFSKQALRCPPTVSLYILFNAGCHQYKLVYVQRWVCVSPFSVKYTQSWCQKPLRPVSFQNRGQHTHRSVALLICRRLVSQRILGQVFGARRVKILAVRKINSCPSPLLNPVDVQCVLRIGRGHSTTRTEGLLVCRGSTHMVDGSISLLLKATPRQVPPEKEV